MRRRAFITLLGGAAAAAWPLAARAQQTGGMRRIGVLMGFAESDPEAKTWIAAFREGLQKLGWREGHNIRIDTRWATPGDVEARQRFAKELVALQPYLILASTTPPTAALLQQTRTIPIIFAIAADPVGCLAPRRLLHVRQHDPRALARQLLRAGAPDPRGGARHEHHLPGHPSPSGRPAPP